MTPTDITRMFSQRFTPPPDDKVIEVTNLMEGYQNLAHMLEATLPDGREKSLVMTKLQESFLFAMSITNKL